MNRIRLLSENVANQIAAGEVVERPASVVKELVENSLDAQARHITVEIQAGGRSLIRVSDDGVGMSRDDALMCLERHATSKIERADDLASIRTMGFRGEAMPSIASVSRMSLTTRERDSESVEGTQVVIHGGKILEVRANGSPPGTTIEVRQIFFNLPARRKFLRSEETERAHILNYLHLAALSQPAVGFTFVQEGRTIFQLPPAATPEAGGDKMRALEERMRALFGREDALLPVNYAARLETAMALELNEENHDRELRVWGFIGAPGVSRASREQHHIFVNRRPVENRGINFALLEGYHTALMKGQYPVCCLFLEIDPALVDVNIHPAKREVRFHNEHAVRRLVADAVRRVLLAFHTAPPKPTSPPPAPAAIPVSPVAASSLAGVGLAAPAAAGEDETTTPSRPIPAERAAPGPPNFNFQWPRREAVSPTALPPSMAARPASIEPEQHEELSLPLPPAPLTVPSQTPIPVAPTSATTGEPVPLLNVPLRILGVVGKLYVVLESDRGLVLLDQHAAHERVLFERVLNRVEQGGEAPSQKLLLPETIELPPRDAEFVRGQLEVLSHLGVGLSEFGERTFLLDGLPPFVKATQPRRFVLGLIDELRASGDKVNSWRLGEHTVAKMVCRHAVKANDSLSLPELENLLTDLRRCTMPYTCPHGRPTIIEMNFRELEKKFGRIA